MRLLHFDCGKPARLDGPEPNADSPNRLREEASETPARHATSSAASRRFEIPRVILQLCGDTASEAQNVWDRARMERMEVQTGAGAGAQSAMGSLARSSESNKSYLTVLLEAAQIEKSPPSCCVHERRVAGLSTMHPRRHRCNVSEHPCICTGIWPTSVVNRL